MPNYTATMQLDRVFHALSDPTRRSVLERLGTGPVAMSKLAAHFSIALSSFSQHLDVLEQCGLVRSQKVGRVRTFELNVETLLVAEDWMTKQRATWEKRLDQFDAFLIKQQGENP